MPSRIDDGRRRAAGCSVIALGLVLSAPSATAHEVPLGNGLHGGIDAATRLYVSVEARRGDGWWTLAARAAGDPQQHRALAAANRAATLHAGRRYRVPESLWPAGLGQSLIRALFPDDRSTSDGWVHRVSNGRVLGRAESPWTIADLFTGDGRNHVKLRLPDRAKNRALHPGDEVVIPWDLVRASLRRGPDDDARPAALRSDGTVATTAGETDGAGMPRLETSAPAPVNVMRPEPFAVTKGVRSHDGLLTYDTDRKGPHAVYRLRAGETLYSHVVLRFTGLLSGKDVNEAARRFARRSGITDVTDIPVGYPIRMPLRDLGAEYLPAGHPRRVAWERERAESERLGQVERRRNLEGVHVVLDVGHGGLDPGAVNGKVWEDDFAYDVACRVKALLEDHTHASVHPLIRDKSTGHAPLSRIRRDSDEVLLTNPALALDDPIAPGVPVNLRWLMSNDIRRRLLAGGVDEDQLVFFSFHADSLHRSARGTMVYYPQANLRVAERRVRGTSYTRFAQAKRENAFRMTRNQMLRSEGVSRQLGEAIVAAVAEADLPVHQFKPVRGHVVRGKPWIPAVLKYNRIPTALLIEICNMNNEDDQRNLRDPAYRQQLAGAVVAGLVKHFEGRRDEAAVQRVSR